MKGQGNKIRDHMVRDARINDPIRRITRIRVIDYSVGKGYNEGRARSSGKGKMKKSKCRGGERTTLPSRVPNYTTNLTTPEVVTLLELWQQS